MRNPYEVLGIKPNASEAEIKAAYKALVKKYHPDKYQNNPLADLAEEKLQEINEAYDILMKNRSGNGSSAYTGQGYGHSAYENHTAAGGSDLYAVRQAIDRGDLAAAEQMLINASSRNAEWFFLSGVLSLRKGYVDDAVSYLRQAMDLDPGNFEYQRAYQQVVYQGSMYRGRSDGQGYSRSNDCCSDCCTFYLCTSCISPCW